MADEHVWTVEIVLTEQDDRTRADARLRRGAGDLAGFGRARRNRADPRLPVVGEELAAARALGDLAHQLLLAALDAVGEHDAVTRESGDPAPTAPPTAPPAAGGPAGPRDAGVVPRRS